MERLFDIGKIVNTHGVKGEIRVIRITDFEERFQPGNQLYLVQKGKDPITVTIETHRIHKQFDLLTFEGYDDIQSVEIFKDSLLKIGEAQLTPLDEGEYYYHEIIGCTIVTDDNEELGVITSILSPGANDVWVVKTKDKKEVLIPYIDDVVKKINIKEKRILVHLLEGLID